MPVVILRGIPGSGKSRLADQIIATVKDGTVVSADDHFMTTSGKYIFNPSELSNAHSKCFIRYLTYLDYHKINDDFTIIVDNTNIHAWEISPYVLAANAHDVPYKIVNMHCEFDVALQRQTHGVRVETMRRMWSDFQSERLPPFWNIEPNVSRAIDGS